MGLTGQAVEVGVADGAFAQYFLSMWRGELYHMVDVWKQLPGYTQDEALWEEYYQKCLNLLVRFPGRGRMHRMLSVEAAKLFPDKYFDFVYLDANHSERSITEDWETWFPKMKPGGVFAGHDYWDRTPVKAVIDIFAVKHELNIVTIPVAHPFDAPSWACVL